MQVSTVVKVNNPRRWPATVTGVNVRYGLGSDSGFGAASVTSAERMQPGDDWWATAEHLADVVQSVAGVELSAAARAALIDGHVPPRGGD